MTIEVCNYPANTWDRDILINSWPIEVHVQLNSFTVAVARLGIEEMKDKQKESIESFASGNGLRRPTLGGLYMYAWKISMLSVLPIQF